MIRQLAGKCASGLRSGLGLGGGGLSVRSRSGELLRMRSGLDQVRSSVNYRGFREKPFCEAEWVQVPKDPLAEQHTNARLFQVLSLFVGLPLVLIMSVANYYGHEHEERPPFVAYSHLRMRTKRFPWGDGKKTLLHNPRVNALTDGYEDEECD